MNKIKYWIITLLVLITIWESYILIFNVPSYIFPSLTKILSSMINNYQKLWIDLVYTSTEIILGFALATTTAIGITIASVYSKYINDTVQPLLFVIQIIPKIALAPLFLIWMGYGISSKIIIAALICFFPIALELKKGIDTVNPDLIDVMKSIGASKKDILLKLQFPHALPYLFSGLKIGIALATIGAIVGEYVSANKGLGYQIAYSATLLNTSMLFAAIFLVVIIGLVFYSTIVLIEKKVVYWKQETNNQ